MSWILMGVILGTIFYSVRIISDYLERERGALLEIEALDWETERLEAQTETEASQRDETREQLADVRDSVSELRERVAVLKGEFEAEEKLSKRVQLAVGREQIKSRRKLVVT